MNININLLKAEKCRRNFYYFIQEFWEQADTSTPVWNWHIEYLANQLQEEAELLLNNKPKKNDIIIIIGTDKLPTIKWVKVLSCIKNRDFENNLEMML